MSFRDDTKCVLCQAQLIRISSYEWGDSLYCDTVGCNFRASISQNRQDIDHYYLHILIDGKRFQFFTSKYGNMSVTKIIDDSIKKTLISFPYFTPYTDNFSYYNYTVNRFVKLRAFL